MQFTTVYAGRGGIITSSYITQFTSVYAGRGCIITSSHTTAFTSVCAGRRSGVCGVSSAPACPRRGSSPRGEGGTRWSGWGPLLNIYLCLSLKTILGLVIGLDVH